MLIEDNPGDVYLVQFALKESDLKCHLTTFANGQEAVRALCQVQTPETAFAPDVIFLDLNTPKSDGFEVLVKLQGVSHLVKVPIAIITSSQAISDKTRAAELGAVRYIHKPSQLDEFVSAIGTAIKEMLG